MQLECPHCREVIEFAAKRPAFCSACGRPLDEPNVHEAATIAQPVTEDRGAASTSNDVPSADAVSMGRLEFVAEYRIVRELGHGGMGVVYEAEHDESGRRVAVKLLSPGSARSPDAMDRFMREGRLAAAFSHPRSTFVFEAGEHAGQPFIAMELMPGRTLQDVSNDAGPMPVPRAIDLMLDVIEGLEAAHAAGVIHRDVKPSNCFIAADGRVKVGDFGLSKSLVADAALTRTGAFMGTPLFAAPEQVRSEKVDERTDIYGVGATLFYLITRRGPFIGEPAAVIAQIASDPAPSLRGLVPTVPKDLDRIIARTLAKAPSDRFTSLRELREAIVPFSSSGLVPAPLGKRLGAYFFDTIVTGVVVGFTLGIVIFVMAMILSGMSTKGRTTVEPAVTRVAEPSTSEPSAETNAAHIRPSYNVQLEGLSRLSLIAGHLMFFLCTVTYFAISEAWSGRSLGKRLVGLRVVDADGGRPGFWRACLRAALVPGLMWLSLAVLSPMLYPEEFGKPRVPGAEEVLMRQSLQPLPFIPMLLCMLSMRARNGFRGLHDLTTGTRVVELRRRTDSARSNDLPVLVSSARDASRRAFGPFRAIGVLGRSGDADMFEGRDEVLNRPVWLFVRPPGAAGATQARAAVARPTRPRWLQGNDDPDARWDCFEAVVGSPLATAVAASPELKWERGRHVLLELADELIAAAGDDTLPARISLDQVWIDRDGHAKLLESPLDPACAKAAGVAGETAPAPSPLALIRTAAALWSRDPSLPAHAETFIAELSARPDEPATLAWAAAELRELVERPGSLRWSDRLVAIGVSTGTEYSGYQIPVSLVALAMLKLRMFAGMAGFAPLLLIGLALPAAAGFWLRGGPVFRFIGIDVRRRSGGPASRVRCAWRSLMAWCPIVVMFSFSVVVMPTLLEGAAVAAENSAADDANLNPSLSVLLLSAGSGLLVLLHGLGAIYAVVRPRRGIQDWLAGTYLVPR